MSKVIDERVVEMRFDNRQFEENIKGTLSTLDKFKHKLHLDGAARGLETVNNAAKKIDMSPLSKGVETVQAKFSALEIMGVTALANLTNSAINAGKRIAASLTIDPVKDGFQEYELTLNAIQTTMAGTGKTAKEVEAELKKLDEYADKTVYSTADMLNNLPKFTNAGVDLGVATKAMIGIANATAHAGGDAGKASIAFYNLGQAIGTGYLSRMDYNSINNAGIATMQWKEQMVEAAIAAGTLKKVGDDSYKAGKKTLTLQQLFIDGLQEQWATTDVMLEVFGNYGDETTEIGKKAYESAQNIKTFSMMMDSLKASAGTGWKDTWQIAFGGLDEATEFWTSIYKVISGIIDSMTDFRNTVLESALGRSFSNLAKQIDGVLSPVSKTADGLSTIVDSVQDYSKIVDQIIAGEWGNGAKRWNDLAEAGYDWAHAQNLVNEKLGDTTKHATKYSGAQNKVSKAQRKSAKSQEELTEANAKRLAQLVELSDAELKAIGYTDEQIDALRELKREADKTGYSVEEFVKNIDKINGRSLLIDSFKNIGQSIAAVFKSVKDALVDIFEITPEGVGQGLYDLIAGFHKLTSYLVVSDETADKMKRTFSGLFAALDIVSTVVGGPLKIALKVLSKLLEVFDMDIWDLTAKIGDAIVAFRDWIDSVLDFTDIFEKIEPALSKGIESVKKWISSLKDDFGNVASNILDGLVNGLGKGVSTVWNAVVNIGKTVIEAIKNILGIHSPSTVMEEIGNNTIQGFTNGISDGVKSITDLVVNIFRTLGAFFPKMAIFNQLAWIITTMKSAGGEITANFGEGISNGVSKVVDAVKKVFASIKDAFGEFDWSKVSAGLWTVSAFIPKAAILNIGAALANMMGVVGTNATDGLKNGISSGASGIFESIGNLIKTMVDFVKDLLGIHSPSTVFLAIGKFLIAGLVLGIVGQKTGLFNVLGNVFGWVVSFVKDTIGGLADWLGNLKLPEIKMEYLLGIGLLAGMVMFAKKLLDIATTFSNGVEAFGKGVKGIGTLAEKLSGKLEPFKKKTTFETIANNMLKLSVAIAILAGSVYVLAQLDTGKLWSSVGAVATLAAVILALGAIISKVDVDGKEFGKFSVMLLSMSVSLWVVSSAIKKLGFLNADNIGYVLGGLAAMIIGFGTLLVLMGTFIKGKTAKNIDKAGFTIMKIAAALSLMIFVTKQLGKMDPAVMKQGMIAIGIFSAVIASLIWSTKLAGSKINSVGPTILKISLAIGIMGIVAKMLGKMPLNALIQGGAAVIALGGIIVGLIAATKLAAGNELQKVGGTIAAVSASIMMLGLTAAILSMVSWQGLLKGGLAVAALGGIVVGLVAATKLATDKELKGVATTVLAMSVAIGVMGATAVVLSMISLEGLAKGVTAVAILGSIMALMVHATKGASDCKGAIMMMAVSIGVMAAAIIILSRIDPNKLTPAVLAMSMVMGMFALMTEAASHIQKGVGVLIVLTLAVGLLAGIIYVLAGLPVESTIAAAVSLSTLVLAVSGAMFILSKMNTNMKNALLGVTALLAMAVPLAAFVGVLALMQNIQNAVSNATVLASLATVMTLLLIPLTIIGAFGMTGAPYLGVLALLAMAVPLAAFVGVLALMEGITNAQANADLLINLATALTDMLIKTSLIAPLALIGVGAMAAMETFMLATGAMVIGIGALMEKFPALERFLDGGIETLKRLAQGVGEIISSFGVGLTSGLPEIGSNLSNFMSNLSGFIAGANSINDGLGGKIATLSGAILLLTAADLIAGISSFIQNGSSFASLGADLSAFMVNATPFIMGISMVKPESLTAVKSLAEAILILTATDLLSGLTSWFSGGVSLADFGAELAAFGPHMAAYAAAVAGIDGSAVEASANAAKALSEMAANLPNSGGWLSAIVGENDMSTFGTQLVEFGKYIKAYSIEVTGIVLEPIMTSVEAGKALAEMADVIPNLGGMVSWFTGDNDMVAFGQQLVGFGAALKSYSLSVTGIALEPIMNSVEAGKALSEMADVIPNFGGMVSWFTGDNDFATFGKQIAIFGAALKNYSKQVGGINSSAIDSSVSCARKLVSLIKNMDGLTTSSVAVFSNAVATLGKTSVNKFISAFTASTAKLTNVGSTMINSVANGIRSASGNLLIAANTIIMSMNNILINRQVLFTTTGIKLMSSLAKGITSNTTASSNAIKSSLNTCVKKMREYYSKFKSAGSYVVDGFVKGIDINTYKAEAEAAAMASAAYQAAMDAIGAASPAKKFIDVGMFADQGLALGLKTYAYFATKASAGLGKDVVEAMQEELGIHSPAKVVKDEVGKYVVQGLAEGIEKDMSAEEAAEQKANNIVSAFKNELSKHDLDKNTADLEYELWEIQNESASAAEKTAQKAESIYKRIASQTEKVALAQGEYQVTFEQFGETSEKTQEAYNKWIQEQISLNNETKALMELQQQSVEDSIAAAEEARSKASEASSLDMSTHSLEYEKWLSQNANASVVEKNSKELEFALKDLPKQAETVGLAKATYEDLKARLGADANETKQAYNDWLQSEIDFSDMITNVQNKFTDAVGEQQQAKQTYFELLTANQNKMLKQGVSLDAIYGWASLQSGYDPRKHGDLLNFDVAGVIANAKSLVDETAAKYAGTTFLANVGGAAGESIATGITNSAPAVETAVQTLGTACSQVANTSGSDWVNLGKQFASKFAEGLTSAGEQIAQSAISMVTSAYQAAIEFINNAESNGMTITPRISPVMDMTNIQNGAQQFNGMFAATTMALADVNVRLSNDSVAQMQSIADEMLANENANHTQLLNELSNLRGDLGALADALNELDINLDGNALVGSLSGRIDASLGRIATYKGRGN